MRNIMAEETKLVAVVIPIYKSHLSDQDRISLDQTYKVLARYPMIVVHPEGLDLSEFRRDYPALQYRSFDKSYFSSIVGYNKLMLAEEFYLAFSDYQYILIDQLDVFIFKDELEQWCLKGYDYIGAPWIQNKIGRLPVVRHFFKSIAYGKRLIGKKSKYFRYGKVGNGGLSLRKVQSHINVIRTQPVQVRLYAEIKNRQHLYNEDTFWAMEPIGFKYPSAQEAMLFSYNKYPEQSYKLTNGATPFGCHGWTKPKYRKFWCTKGDVPTMP